MASLRDRRWTKDRSTGERARTSYRGKQPWEVRWTDNNGTDQSASFARKDEAQSYKRDLEGGLNRGDWVDPRTTGVLFEELAGRWWPTTVKLAPHTRRGYHRLLHGHVLPYFGRMPQTAIDWLTVETFIAEKLANPYDPKYVRDMVSIVSLVMKLAMRAGLRRDNPASQHSIEVRQKKLTQGDTVTMEEAHRLVAHTRDPYKPLVWILVLCGLRPQEVCGLRVEHVDFARRTLHIEETINFVHAFGDEPAAVYRGPTKTAAGDRFLPIPPSLTDDLSAMLTARASNRGSAIELDEPLFEAVHGGKPLIVDDLRRRIVLPALKAAGLSTKVRTYDTRHTHALILLEDGAQILEVAQRMGHDPIVTMRNYGHVRNEAQQRLTDRMEELRQAAADSTVPDPRSEAEVIDLFTRKRAAE